MNAKRNCDWLGVRDGFRSEPLGGIRVQITPANMMMEAKLRATEPRENRLRPSAPRSATGPPRELSLQSVITIGSG
jgi:hypothetical protein